jgi:hypothetical protein
MTNSVAVWRAARAGFELMRGMVIGAALAGQLGTVIGCLDIPYSRLVRRALISEAAAAPTSGTCAAQNFSAFIEVFSESAAMQRRYTHMPLVYGLLDANMLGTLKEDDAFSTRTINSFEALPFFNKMDGGRIFPSKKKRREQGLEIKVDADSEHGGNGMIAAIILPDTGVYVGYRFEATGTCWTLVEIDDRST